MMDIVERLSKWKLTESSIYDAELLMRLAAVEIEQLRTQLSSMPPSADVLLEALRDMVDSYQYEASSDNPALLNAKKGLEAYEAKLLPKE
jgi:hypothetical protein